MSSKNYTLRAYLKEGVSEIYSADAAVLRAFGRSYFQATLPRPELELINPAGQIVDVMDIWADDWLGQPTEKDATDAP